MSDVNDQQDGQGAESTGEPADNTKAEMNRKFSNLNEQIAQQNARLEQMLQAISQQAAPQAPTAPAKPLKDLVYDDPDAFVKQVVAQASAAANQQIEQRVSLSTATQSVIADLQEKYPEFAQANGAAAKLALERASRQPNGLKGTPEGARLAMMDAVAELGLVPASRRTQQTNGDDFVGGGTGQSSRQTRGSAGDPKKGIDPITLEFAAALGVDVSDPKRLEGLKTASSRKNWNRYS